ncbi:Enamine deaminase RidA, house cleaning of reactive enamine intermediates, YjgF/YER057c/UK114 family [Variovorax sp. HW608]|uniref:RidA family protein n=1 Tax=Variovorax sp. HW608 TaxID=1034889 RepID=UPI00082015A3|nr:RidA family protein [Variovorax sp. HW608]SCK52194.1 Enamine deaminase RidA, house cleaning of reactive enamine intermediates, YjgF/YER057c/UK114 family [Variovorax sp. HW608]
MTTQAAMPVRRVACEAVPDLPHAIWSNALVVGQEVVLSGQTAHPATRDAAQAGRPLGAYEQTLVVLRKVQALLEAAGGGIHNIVKLVVYVTDIADKDEVGRARRDFFAQLPECAYPASTLVAVSALVFPELRVEIDAFARLDVDLRTAN